MEILESFLQQSKDKLQNQLDAIDVNQICCISMKKAKFVEKLNIYRQWNDMLVHAANKTDEEINKIKEMVNKSRMKLKKQSDDLQMLRADLEQLREELDNDDSGIGEMLTTAQWDDNQTDLENRQIAIGEAINDLSNELEQLSMELNALDRTKTNIKEQHAELHQKFDQLSIEIQQVIDTLN